MPYALETVVSLLGAIRRTEIKKVRLVERNMSTTKRKMNPIKSPRRAKMEKKPTMTRKSTPKPKP